MFPFWEVAVAPVLEAARARRLVEIGALRGENTRLIIERLGPDTELHVIDPLPDFDPAVHEEEFGGQYVFHRDLSLNVLGDLPPMDAALVDGDHNWYTVYNELRLLAEVARAEDAPLPVLLLHDVGWPYGRRDLYYDPDNIPEEYRNDWRRAGMEPGKVRLVPFGAGLNPTLANAKVEGGRRNGVMTALDDFVREHDRPVRVVFLPIYFGLAIAVEEDRLARQPELAAELDRLESPVGKDQLLELAEDIRIQALMFQHRIYYDREAMVHRLARLYLGQVRQGAVDQAGLEALEADLDAVVEQYVLGDFVSLGPDHRRVTPFLGAYLEAYDLRGRHLWALGPDGSGDGLDDRLEQLGVHPDRVRVGGWEPDDTEASGGDLPEAVAVLHVGGESGPSPTLDALCGRLAVGGLVVVDDDAGADVRADFAEVCGRHGLVEVDAREGGAWRRPGDAAGAGAAGSSPTRPVDELA